MVKRHCSVSRKELSEALKAVELDNVFESLPPMSKGRREMRY